MFVFVSYFVILLDIPNRNMFVFVSYFVILLKFVVVIIRISSSLKLLKFSWISPKFVVSIPLGGKGGRVMVFNGTFNNISVISFRLVLLMEETGVSREDYQHFAMQ